MLTEKQLIVIALIGAALILLAKSDMCKGLIKNKGAVTEGVSVSVPVAASVALDAPSAPAPQVKEAHSQVQDIPFNTQILEPAMPSNGEPAPQGNFQPSAAGSLGAFRADMVSPADLLPVDGCFSESNPAVPSTHLTDQNFLTSGHHAGINTQGSSLRNPNLQLRSDPLIPRRDVGPWSQSTIEADTNRRQFDIGCA